MLGFFLGKPKSKSLTVQFQSKSKNNFRPPSYSLPLRPFKMPATGTRSSRSERAARRDTLAEESNKHRVKILKKTKAAKIAKEAAKIIRLEFGTEDGDVVRYHPVASDSFGDFVNRYCADSKRDKRLFQFACMGIVPEPETSIGALKKKFGWLYFNVFPFPC